MKRIYKYFASLLILCGANSCLDIDIVDKLTVDDYYETEDQALYAINGVYSIFQEFQYFKTNWAIVMPNYGDDIFSPSNSAYSDVSLNTHNDTSNSTTMWTKIYAGVNNVNTLIKALPNMEFSAETEENRGRLLAEARALRAIFYYDLVRLYGGVNGVPLRTEPTSSSSYEYIGQSPKEDVYKQIIEDLTFAIQDSYLPARADGNNFVPGRLCDEAAHAVLAEVYLTIGEWQLAIDQAEEVLRSWPYAMIGGAQGGYGRIWDVDYEASHAHCEYILYVPFFNDTNSTDASSLGSNAAYLYCPRGLGANGEKLSGTTKGTGEGSFKVQRWFIDYYVNDRGNFGFSDPNTSVESLMTTTPAQLQTKDYRTEVSFFRSYCTVDNSGAISKRVACFPATGGGDAVDKYGYIAKFQDPSGIANRTNGNDIPRLRIPDMYLILAEAHNELGHYAEACENIDMVRRRAREADGITPRAYPKLLSSTSEDYLGRELSQDEFRWLIFMERGLEFAGEQKRWFDLVRMQYNSSISMYDYMMSTFVPSQDPTMWDAGCVMASRKKCFPIPYLECYRNEGVIQNPGY